MSGENNDEKVWEASNPWVTSGGGGGAELDGQVIGNDDGAWDAGAANDDEEELVLIDDDANEGGAGGDRLAFYADDEPVLGGSATAGAGDGSFWGTRDPFGGSRTSGTGGGGGGAGGEQQVVDPVSLLSRLQENDHHQHTTAMGAAPQDMEDLLNLMDDNNNNAQHTSSARHSALAVQMALPAAGMMGGPEGALMMQQILGRIQAGGDVSNGESVHPADGIPDPTGNGDDDPEYQEFLRSGGFGAPATVADPNPFAGAGGNPFSAGLEAQMLALVAAEQNQAAAETEDPHASYVPAPTETGLAGLGAGGGGVSSQLLRELNHEKKVAEDEQKGVNQGLKPGQLLFSPHDHQQGGEEIMERGGGTASSGAQQSPTATHQTKQQGVDMRLVEEDDVAFSMLEQLDGEFKVQEQAGATRATAAEKVEAAHAAAAAVAAEELGQQRAREEEAENQRRAEEAAQERHRLAVEEAERKRKERGEVYGSNPEAPMESHSERLTASLIPGFLPALARKIQRLGSRKDIIRNHRMRCFEQNSRMCGLHAAMIHQDVIPVPDHFANQAPPGENVTLDPSSLPEHGGSRFPAEPQPRLAVDPEDSPPTPNAQDNLAINQPNLTGGGEEDNAEKVLAAAARHRFAGHAASTWWRGVEHEEHTPERSLGDVNPRLFRPKPASAEVLLGQNVNSTSPTKEEGEGEGGAAAPSPVAEVKPTSWLSAHTPAVASVTAANSAKAQMVLHALKEGAPPRDVVIETAKYIPFVGDRVGEPKCPEPAPYCRHTAEELEIAHYAKRGTISLAPVFKPQPSLGASLDAAWSQTKRPAAPGKSHTPSGHFGTCRLVHARLSSDNRIRFTGPDHRDDDGAVVDDDEADSSEDEEEALLLNASEAAAAAATAGGGGGATAVGGGDRKDWENPDLSRRQKKALLREERKRSTWIPGSTSDGGITKGPVMDGDALLHEPSRRRVVPAPRVEPTTTEGDADKTTGSSKSVTTSPALVPQTPVELLAPLTSYVPEAPSARHSLPAVAYPTYENSQGLLPWERQRYTWGMARGSHEVITVVHLRREAQYFNPQAMGMYTVGDLVCTVCPEDQTFRLGRVCRIEKMANIADEVKAKHVGGFVVENVETNKPVEYKKVWRERFKMVSRKEELLLHFVQHELKDDTPGIMAPTQPSLMEFYEVEIDLTMKQVFVFCLVNNQKFRSLNDVIAARFVGSGLFGHDGNSKVWFIGVDAIGPLVNYERGTGKVHPDFIPKITLEERMEIFKCPPSTFPRDPRGDGGAKAGNFYNTSSPAPAKPLSSKAITDATLARVFNPSLVEMRKLLPVGHKAFCYRYTTPGASNPMYHTDTELRNMMKTHLEKNKTAENEKAIEGLQRRFSSGKTAAMALSGVAQMLQNATPGNEVEQVQQIQAHVAQMQQEAIEQEQFNHIMMAGGMASGAFGVPTVGPDGVTYVCGPDGHYYPTPTVETGAWPSMAGATAIKVGFDNKDGVKPTPLIGQMTIDGSGATSSSSPTPARSGASNTATSTKISADAAPFQPSWLKNAATTETTTTPTPTETTTSSAVPPSADLSSTSSLSPDKPVPPAAHQATYNSIVEYAVNSKASVRFGGGGGVAGPVAAGDSVPVSPQQTSSQLLTTGNYSGYLTAGETQAQTLARERLHEELMAQEEEQELPPLPAGAHRLDRPLLRLGEEETSENNNPQAQNLIPNSKAYCDFIVENARLSDIPNRDQQPSEKFFTAVVQVMSADPSKILVKRSEGKLSRTSTKRMPSGATEKEKAADLAKADKGRSLIPCDRGSENTAPTSFREMASLSDEVKDSALELIPLVLMHLSALQMQVTNRDREDGGGGGGGGGQQDKDEQDEDHGPLDGVSLALVRLQNRLMTFSPYSAELGDTKLSDSAAKDAEEESKGGAGGGATPVTSALYHRVVVVNFKGLFHNWLVAVGVRCQELGKPLPFYAFHYAQSEVSDFPLNCSHSQSETRVSRVPREEALKADRALIEGSYISFLGNLEAISQFFELQIRKWCSCFMSFTQEQRAQIEPQNTQWAMHSSPYKLNKLLHRKGEPPGEPPILQGEERAFEEWCDAMWNSCAMTGTVLPMCERLLHLGGYLSKSHMKKLGRLLRTEIGCFHSRIRPMAGSAQEAVYRPKSVGSASNSPSKK